MCVVLVDWVLGDGSRLHLRANFAGKDASGVERTPGVILHTEGQVPDGSGLGPWSGIWTLEAA